MNNRIRGFVVLGVAAICVWLATGPGIPGKWQVAAGSFDEERSTQDAAGQSADGAPVRTKAADRPDNPPRYTHGPERLRDFMLPAMSIRELSLDEALRKLTDSYEQACRISGEKALPLEFLIPPRGAARKLTLRLPEGSFTASVQLLATLSGMTVSRNGREYRFEPLAEERTEVSKGFRVPPDFNSALEEMANLAAPRDEDSPAPQEPEAPKPVSEYLTALGLELDPSTHLALGSSGNLTLETTSAADVATISELTRILTDLPRTQMKFDSKLVEIPAGIDWNPPDGSQLTADEARALVWELSQSEGVDMETLPSVTSRSGQTASLEMVREFIYPNDGDGGVFESRNIGKTMKFQGGLLGFGQDLSVDYNNTTAEIEPSTTKPLFNVRTVKHSGFSQDGGTRFVVQTRSDGSRSLLLINSTLIDPTGRPLR